jgi:uncharacterized membrane protein YtjA (UPF0391 family)
VWRITFKVGFALLVAAVAAALLGFGSGAGGPHMGARILFVVLLVLAGAAFAAGWYVRRLERY